MVFEYRNTWARTCLCANPPSMPRKKTKNLRSFVEKAFGRKARRRDERSGDGATPKQGVTQGPALITMDALGGGGGGGVLRLEKKHVARRRQQRRQDRSKNQTGGNRHSLGRAPNLFSSRQSASNVPPPKWRWGVRRKPSVRWRLVFPFSKDEADSESRMWCNKSAVPVLRRYFSIRVIAVDLGQGPWRVCRRSAGFRPMVGLTPVLKITTEVAPFLGGRQGKIRPWPRRGSRATA